jgi:hypothetical protein
MREDDLLRASEGCDSVAELARMIGQTDPHNANAPANRLGQEGASHDYDESPRLLQRTSCRMIRVRLGRLTGLMSIATTTEPRSVLTTREIELRM